MGCLSLASDNLVDVTGKKFGFTIGDDAFVHDSNAAGVDSIRNSLAGFALGSSSILILIE